MEVILISLAKTTIIQCLSVFGIFFVFGYVLSLIQTRIQTAYREAIGWSGILFTAWIGTPVHELGHALFAVIFRHHITSLSVFRPNQSTGSLGSVEHTYNPKSVYQSIGNFFIGAAPMITGTVATCLLFILLLPGQTWASLQGFFQFASWSTVVSFMVSFFQTVPLSWKTALFLYLSFCIASHIAPSLADQKNMWSGFVWIIIIFFVANSIALALHRDLMPVIHLTGSLLQLLLAMMIYTFFVSIVHLVLVSILFLPIRRHI